MVKYFDLHLRVAENKLPTVLGTLMPEAEVMLISVTPSDIIEPGPKRRYINGCRSKGISGEDLMLQIIKDKPVKYETLIDAFVEKGFSRNSVSPVTNKLCKAGKITKQKKPDGIFFSKPEGKT